MMGRTWLGGWLAHGQPNGGKRRRLLHVPRRSRPTLASRAEPSGGGSADAAGEQGRPQLSAAPRPGP